jgi:hypothetical protein
MEDKDTRSADSPEGKWWKHQGHSAQGWDQEVAMK